GRRVPSLLGIGATLLAVPTSCNPTSKSTSQPATDTKAGTAVNQTWTFEAASALARGPLRTTLQVSGAGPKAPFHWSVTISDSNGSILFRTEHDDRAIDQFFGDDGFIDGCRGYDACKTK